MTRDELKAGTFVTNEHGYERLITLVYSNGEFQYTYITQPHQSDEYEVFSGDARSLSYFDLVVYKSPQRRLRIRLLFGDTLPVKNDSPITYDDIDWGW